MIWSTDLESAVCWVHPSTSWGWLQYCVCIGINIAWSSWHHLAGSLSDSTPPHHGNMSVDGYWIQIRARRPDIQQLLLQSSGRGSGWATRIHTHTYIHTHIHTHTLVSAVFGQFSSVLYPQQRDHKAVYKTQHLWQHGRYRTVITDGNTHAHTLKSTCTNTHTYVGDWACTQN